MGRSETALGHRIGQACVVQVEMQPGEAVAEAFGGRQRLVASEEMAPAALVEAHGPEKARKRRLVGEKTGRRGRRADHPQNTWRRMKYRMPARVIAAGSVITQASAMLRTVDICSPEPLAAMVPATPEDRMWVVETGSP